MCNFTLSNGLLALYYRIVTRACISDSVVEGAVGLVLVESGAQVNAITVSFFSEVAHHPTTLWVSVSKASYTHELIMEVRRFTLTVLGKHQRGLAVSCGMVSGHDQKTSAPLNLSRSTSGLLFLKGGLASTLCVVREHFDLDEYTLFIADISESLLDSRMSRFRHLLKSDF